MNAIATLVFLIGLAPGAFLPSAITEQLIAPPAKTAADRDTNEAPSTQDPTQGHSNSIHAGSSYTALRPASFPFTKGDLRAIQILHEQLLSHLFVSQPGIPVIQICGHQAIMQPDHCVAHKAVVTSPAISAQAPPASTE